MPARVGRQAGTRHCPYGYLNSYDEDGTESLAAHVVPNLPFEEAYKQLKQFDWQWWLKVVDQAGLKFYVDLRFK